MTQGNWPAVPLTNPLIANRYRKGRSLGSGGFGEVFFGEDLKFTPSRQVAIKLIHPFLLLDPLVRDGITNEANILSQFKHPNILRVLDFEISRDSAFIVTELADGGSLAGKLQPDLNQPPVPLPPKDVLYFLEHIASALDEAHDQGIIHRDIKPANILLDKNGRPLLADFQFAMTISNSVSLKALSAVFGTPQYTAPEVWEDKVGKASDIYALGVVLYEMITGYTPFNGSPLALMKQHLNDAVPLINARYPALNYPAELEAVIARSLAKDPTQRYRKAGELYLAFKMVLDNHKFDVDNPVIQKANPPQNTAAGVVQNQPVKLPPPNPELEKLINFQSEGYWSQIIQLGEEILRSNPGDKVVKELVGEAFCNLGLNHIKYENWSEALMCFEKALKFDTSKAEYHKHYGICMIKLGQNSLAESSLSKAIERNRKDGETFYLRGKCFYELWSAKKDNGYLDKAISDFNISIQLADQRATYLAEANFWLGRSFFEPRNEIDTYAARVCLDKAVELAPNTAEYYYWRGLTKAFSNYAFGDFSKAIELDPDNYLYYTERGNWYLTNNLEDKAILDFTKVIELTQHSASYFLRGRTYQVSGEHSLALIDFNQAINLGTNNWRVFIAKGKSDIELGFYMAAVKDFTQAFMLENNQPVENYKLFGISLYEVNNYATALDYLSKACEMSQGEGELYFWRGLVHKEMENKSLARRDFETAIELGFAAAVKAKKSLGWF